MRDAGWTCFWLLGNNKLAIDGREQAGQERKSGKGVGNASNAEHCERQDIEGNRAVVREASFQSNRGGGLGPDHL